MCTPLVGELTEGLLQTYIEQDLGVSLKGLVQKWDTEEQVNDVVQKIQKCNNLKYLELEGNTLGVAAAKAIGKALESKSELEAALWKDLFTGRLKDEIPTALQFLLGGVDLAYARLQYLELSDNAIGPLGMIGLAPFFKKTSSFSLKVLICTNNGLGPQGAELFSKALIDCRKQSLRLGGEVFNLKKFVCGRNRMQNKGALAIAQFIKECDSLEEIHLHENSIYWQAQSELAEAFLCNPNLRVINLNDNTIAGKGLKMLSDTFQRLPNLQDLNLGDCLLRNIGSIHVVKAIKDLPKLERLVLEGNEIGRSGGIEIAEMLRSNRSMKSINFNANCFGVEGTEIVGELLNHLELQMEDMEESDNEEEEEENEEGDEGEQSDEDESVDEEEDEEESEAGSDDDYDDDPIAKVMTFFEHPTVENYQAVPAPGPTEYLYDLSTEEKEPYWVCIETAVKMVYIYSKDPKPPELVEHIFTEMMSEAARLAITMPNEFTTCLLINLGVFRTEDKTYLQTELCDLIIEYLHNWLINGPDEADFDLPESVLACLKTAFTNVRPELKVNTPIKLATLIQSVVKEREMLRNEVTNQSSDVDRFGVA